MISDRAIQWLRLSLVRGVGPIMGRKLIHAAGSIDALWNLSKTALESLDGIGPQLIAALSEAQPDNTSDSTQKTLECCHNNQIGLLCPEDDAWPESLSMLDDAPLVLFYHGGVQSLNAQQMLAVVGARKASREGLLITRRWCRYLSDRQTTIVSGMAYGIDAAAHGGALEGTSATIAVLGCGLGRLSEQQQDQAAAVSAQGCVISEFLPEVTARPEHFPRRNRIIAGLSHATLVMEADVRSGSLITARQTLEYGREVFAVPGSVLGNKHGGCHQLIRDGSVLIENAEEILQGMGWEAHSTHSGLKKIYLPADATEAKLLQILATESMHLDHLSESCGLTVPELSPILLRLELQGVIERLPGSRYLLACTISK